MLFPFPESEVKKILSARNNRPCVFLESAAPSRGEHTSLLFSDFDTVLTFRCGDNLEVFFRAIETALDSNFWLCGYFTYEFGYFLEPALHACVEQNGAVLAWLGVCKKPLRFNHRHRRPPSRQVVSSCQLTQVAPTIDQATYNDNIAAIKRYIEQGLTYQVNYTFKIKFGCAGNPIDMYLALRRQQPTAYAAYIHTDNTHILSFSPELFFRLQGNTITTKPMKGTYRRGLTIGDDAQCYRQFQQDTKTKAENIMIVDLLRNDLGKIAQRIKVPALFAIEQYRTLYQMTSTIKATLARYRPVSDIIKALFPSGSVTGAPKIKTMQLIKNLEGEARGVYTGAIGYISPQRNMCFNIAIRTVTLNGTQGEIGIGGGIVYDSGAGSEYTEALLKAKFLTQTPPQFSLIESLLWQRNKGYFLLNEHLKRLKDSCAYFSIPLPARAIRRSLTLLEKKMKNEKSKVRITLAATGAFTVENQPLEDVSAPVRLAMSRRPIDPQDVFLYHKTTQRAVYDEALSQARKQGYFDILFSNIYGELTEGSFSNLFIKLGNMLYTPPVTCGLLGGVLRQHLISQGAAQEKVLYIKDIASADKIYIGNSVRGLLRAEISLADFENKSTIGIQTNCCKS